MALIGIDTSSHQATLDLTLISYDFILVKATEGTTYVNPFCDPQYQLAKASGKKRAIYHFIRFDEDIIAQADAFVDNCKGYERDAIYVLDWEGTGVDRVGDALAFLRRVRDRIGYKPAIYMSEWVENHYDWSPVVAEDFGLIAAKYSDYEIDNNYDMSSAGSPPHLIHWPFYFMWQWTSKGHLNGYAGDLDCDIAYVTPAGWDAYAGYQEPAPTTTTTTTIAVEPETTTTTTQALTATTTTTTVGTEPTTTTTTLPTTTTTTVDERVDYAPETDEKPSWATVIVAIIMAILNRLRGVN